MFRRSLATSSLHRQESEIRPNREIFFLTCYFTNLLLSHVERDTQREYMLVRNK